MTGHRSTLRLLGRHYMAVLSVVMFLCGTVRVANGQWVRAVLDMMMSVAFFIWWDGQ